MWVRTVRVLVTDGKPGRAKEPESPSGWSGTVGQKLDDTT